MNKTSVLILGGSGMLGSMLVDVFSRNPAFQVTATVRNEDMRRKCMARIPGVEWRIMDVAADPAAVFSCFPAQQWVVNAIGIIKPYARDDRPAEVFNAIRGNAVFPHIMAQSFLPSGTRIIQIATDCVYSGCKGSYLETDKHDALDVYGKTKSLGEVGLPGFSNLRCSIIGPEPRAKVSLLEWFLGQKQGAELSGFVNHRWNGVTTLHFARICAGAISSADQLPVLRHLVPADVVNKSELVNCFAAVFKRPDLKIKPVAAKDAVDRTLATTDPETNARIWRNAGYEKPPTIRQMIEELSVFDYRMRDL